MPKWLDRIARLTLLTLAGWWLIRRLPAPPPTRPVRLTPIVTATPTPSVRPPEAEDVYADMPAEAPNAHTGMFFADWQPEFTQIPPAVLEVPPNRDPVPTFFKPH